MKIKTVYLRVKCGDSQCTTHYNLNLKNNLIKKGSSNIYKNVNKLIYDKCEWCPIEESKSPEWMIRESLGQD